MNCIVVFLRQFMAPTAEYLVVLHPDQIVTSAHTHLYVVYREPKTMVSYM